MAETAVDFKSIKEKQRAGWETGDYPRVGNTLQIIAEQLVEAADVRAGQRALDVACGQGNAALAAARRFAEATGVDYAANLLERGRERAAVESLPVTFLEGDAEDLPVPDRSFDLSLSTAGGMVGRMFKTVAKWAPPPAGVQPATLWGEPDHLAELFGDRVAWTSTEKRHYVFRYHSPEHFSEWFREFYGPITRLAGGLSGEDADKFSADLADVAREYNRADDGTVAAPAEYLEAVGVRQD